MALVVRRTWIVCARDAHTSTHSSTTCSARCDELNKEGERYQPEIFLVKPSLRHPSQSLSTRLWQLASLPLFDPFLLGREPPHQ